MAGVLVVVTRQIFIMSEAPEAGEAQRIMDTQAPLGKETLEAMALRISGRTTTEEEVAVLAQQAEMLMFTAEAELAAQEKPHY
jgi:hypothetical protein